MMPMTLEDLLDAVMVSVEDIRSAIEREEFFGPDPDDEAARDHGFCVRCYRACGGDICEMCSREVLMLEGGKA